MIVPIETDSNGSSSSPTETSHGASSSSTENNYEVFLSFRGLDTRNNFTDHLYSGLLSAGIRAFRDNEELHQGKEIGPDLFAAIKSSKIMIPILSVNYGSSKWCLDELVQIMECKNNKKGHLVLPIFYKVEPADVRYQKGSFGEAFRERERREREGGIDQLIFQKRKEALQQVSNLKGHEVNGNRSEAGLIKSIVRQVLFQLKERFELVVPENLIGIDTHVNKIMKVVKNSSLATLFVGIWGIGGIGKTTLAKTIYNNLFNQFEHHCFIADVKESCKAKGPVYLQNQLIFAILKQENQVSNKDQGIKYISSRFKCKKVLILLDDIGDDHQLEALAGNRNWFSSGSIIIITTRNKGILDKVRVDCSYEHEKMDQQNSLILFNRHAFRMDSPPSEFKDLTRAVVSTTGGLPLSLKVLGSFLSGKETTVWRGTIEKLKEVPNEEVQQSLKISYDDLTYEGKQIFLDVACFFIGTDWRIPSYMWEACKFFPKVEIEELRLLSLIKVGDNHKLRMHDQLRDLGRAIVREEDKMNPGNRSRLWDFDDASNVLKENEGTEKIEAIRINKYNFTLFGKGDNTLTCEQFKKLRNLRFLQGNGPYLCGDFRNSVKKLKWLQWQNCPSTFDFHLEELVILNLSENYISDKWQGWSSIVMASKLKYLHLSCFWCLRKTDFLSAFRNLEVLIIEYCSEIVQIDSSIGNMKSLVCLELAKCEGLKELPAEVSKLEALEQLLLVETGIEQLPDNIGNLQNLEILNISGTRIKALPIGIGRLRKLRDLDASDCYLEREIPESICHCSSLQNLYLLNSMEVQLPPVLPSSLTFLGITCQSRKLPSLSNLTHLKELRLHYCEFLEYLWEKPSALSETFELDILEIKYCNLIQTLDVSQFKHLKILFARGCENLREIRGLDRLESLWISECRSIERLNLPKSEVLKRLGAQNCKNLAKVQGLNGLESLEEISISHASIQRLDISNCSGLKKLSVKSCEKLLEVQGLDRLESLKILELHDCEFLECLWEKPSALSERSLNTPFELEILKIEFCDLIQTLDVSQFKHLKTLSIEYCLNLREIRGLNRLKYLESICIDHCSSIERLNLPKSQGLKRLSAQFCIDLAEVQGLNGLESLGEIDISFASIHKLDISNCSGLKKLSVKYCENLLEVQGLDKLESLKILDVSGSTSFESLPDMCCFDTLQKLAINYCDNLHDIQSLERFPSCTILQIAVCKSLTKFPNLSNFRNLLTLFLSDCHELREIPGLEVSTSLKHIRISGCSSIDILPDLSSCTNLISLIVQDCDKLTELRGLEKLEQLVKLDISGCKSLVTIPELPGGRLYQNFEKKHYWSLDDYVIKFGEENQDEFE